MKMSKNLHEFLGSLQNKLRFVFKLECQSGTEKCDIFLHVYFDKSTIICQNLKSRFQLFLYFQRHSFKSFLSETKWTDLNECL